MKCRSRTWRNTVCCCRNWDAPAIRWRRCSTSATRDTLEALFHERRLKPIISMELDSSELTKRFVAADVGISFISRSNVAEELKSKTLAGLKIADAVLQRDLALVFRKDKALSRAALAFIEIAVKLKTGAPAIGAARTS